IPRRWLDFSTNDMATWLARRDDLPTTLIGWALLVAILEMTVRVSLLRPDMVRRPTGPGPAFLFLGAWLTCFHFMYYDVLLAALPIFLLFTEPWRYLEPHLIVIMRVPGKVLGAGVTNYFRPRLAHHVPFALPFLCPEHGSIWVCNRIVPTLVVAF